MSPPVDEAGVGAPDREPPPAPFPPRLHVVQGGLSGEGPPARVLLPQNLEAEESVVGGILRYGQSALTKVRDLLGPEDFYHPVLAVIYEAALALGTESVPIDGISVAEKLRLMDQFHKLKCYNNEAYLGELVAKVATDENIAYHATIIRNKACARRLIDANSDLLRRAYSEHDIEQLVNAHQAQVAEIALRVPRPKVALFDKDAFLKDCLAALKEEIPAKLPFGIAALDEAMGGGCPSGGVVALVAPPKHQKTAFMIECICRWARLGQRILYITGENTAQEIYARLIAHEEFGRSNKFHGTIKHEFAQAEQNSKAIEWMAGTVRIVSLPDEEIREPPGPQWQHVVRQAEAEKVAPMLFVDYVEEFADRLPGRAAMTEQDANKKVIKLLKNYALRRRARVLAVCSVGRGTYGNVESVFKNPDSRPEDFASVSKHSGYIDYAVSAILALQFAGDQETIRDEQGHPCTPMRLHLAMTREGPGPVTVPVLGYGGYCRFVEDQRSEATEDDATTLKGLQGTIVRELAKPENADGQTGEQIAKLIGRRVQTVAREVKLMAKEGLIAVIKKGRAEKFRHLKYHKGGIQSAFGLEEDDDDDKGWKN